MRRGSRAAALVLAVLVLAGCSDSYDFKFPEEAKIDVDTPDLRQAKKDAGVEPCRPGTGASDLPALTLPCFGGGPDVDLSTLAGPLVVNLWAVNCGPCREEMPVLEEFHQQYADQVAIIGVDYNDPQAGAAMELVQETGVTYPLLADPQQDLLGADPFSTMVGLPTFAFVRADGTVKLAAGGVDNLDEFVELAETKLGIKL
jgi:thiol-disulfide isomerase/thioredoxin